MARLADKTGLVRNDHVDRIMFPEYLQNERLRAA